MRLFIAEKPSVAKAIAAELGVKSKGEGFLECSDGSTVTWCFGHMLEQAEPDEYTSADVPVNRTGKKIWRVEDLPIIPETWVLHPKTEAKKQLATIGRLLKDAKEIVHAGDPDREGQLLVNDVLDLFASKCSGKVVRRFWVSAQDAVSVRRGLAAMKRNDEFAGWADAARGRARADWLIGMNLSRAYTLRAQRGGSRALITVGRVQTPTLAVVVARDRAIESFRSAAYHTITIAVRHAAGDFTAKWKPQDNQAGLDSEGRLTDTSIADALVAAMHGQQGVVATCKSELKKQLHPLAFSLADLTVAASRMFGYSAQAVLETCQALYETHKLTSYPRTDCAYLPESQHGDAAEVLAAIKQVNPDLSHLVDGADLSIKSRVWDDSKVTAHHGIVPTMHRGSAAKLNDMERNIYSVVVRAYLAQFYPVHEFKQTLVTLEIKGQAFAASGSVVVRGGWRDVYAPSDDEAAEGDDEEAQVQPLPPMDEGDAVTCMRAVRKDAKTKPPRRFTEGTLIRAMENIHAFVSNPEHKKMLREGDGLGTPATRASIITELKNREFLESKGKSVISTALGRSVIDALPEVVRNPVLTALFERMLKRIEQGEGELAGFFQRQEQFIRDQVAKANDGSVAIAGGKPPAIVSKEYTCKACGLGLSRRSSTKPRASAWWGCSGFPKCEQTYPDVKGQPDYSKGRNSAALDK